ncbi:hypothetical protein Fmac_012348 [Flemingia macrophylla]|uniref:Uncharacterized protein n=1 Tax=Flemingia macrophylla TaxID=520843 RepID=A0ABD1MQ14_9FABA
MAENLDDGEFWLPSQFLTDEDDTESDDDDHVAELTRQLAHSTLAKPKGASGSGSPQSTLSAFGSSGKGSSPDGVVSQESATWDLLRAAAGEVERMRLADDRYRYRYRYGCGYGFGFNNDAAVKPCPPAAVGVGVRFYSHAHRTQQQPFSQHQLQIAQFEMMRQQMVPNGGRNNLNNNNNVGCLSGSAWPPLQNASGMRAVFLAGSRESAGTGVFLPRAVDTRTESRKKPACKTVLVPDRVAHALNLNVKAVTNGHTQQQLHHPRVNQHPRVNGSAVPKRRSNNNNNNHGFSHQKRNNPKQQPQPQVVSNHEIHLPQEWTY